MIARRLSLLAIPLLAASAGVASLRSDDVGDVKKRDAERELIELDRAWARAVVACDREEVARIIAADFVVVDSTGHDWNRERYLDGVASGVGGLQAIELRDYQVRFLGATAVLRARLIYRAGPGRSDLNGAYRFTKTYVCSGDRWRCVSAQETRIVE